MVALQATSDLKTSQLHNYGCSVISGREIVKRGERIEANRLTQCCTQFKSPGTKILCLLYLHDNVAFIFK